MFKLSTFIISIFLLQGCNALHQETTKNTLKSPKWLLDPYIENDTIAAIGCAKRHFKGIEAQKDLAISRAVDRIATQKSVTVDNVTLYKKESSNGQKGRTSSHSSSLHGVEKVNVSTKIKDLYTKPDGEICVWVVEK